MGLSKEIRMPNGVVLGYHRIVTLTQHVNVATIFEVQSYLNEAERIREQEAYAANEQAGEAIAEIDVYVDVNFFHLDYDPEMTVAKAYAYLKTLGDYEGAEDVIDKWVVGMSYFVGDIVVDGEQEYECIQSHASQEGWEPHATPALWKVHEEGGDGIPVWSQPTGAHDAYKTGDKVHYPTIDDPVYESTMDANVYSPEAYPQGWQLVEGGE